VLHGGEPVGEAEGAIEGEFVDEAGVYELNEAQASGAELALLQFGEAA
jgi:hypothetical protein